MVKKLDSSRIPTQVVEQWEIGRLIEYVRNPRKNDHAVDRIASAIHEFGFRVPILAKSDGSVIDGHLRIKAARKLGMTTVPVLLADDMTDLQIKAFRLSVNKMAELAGWDDELLKIELSELKGAEFDLSLTGFAIDEIDLLLDVGGEPGGGPSGNGSLSDRFMIPPFSVLNAREGWWQDRKRAWLALGIKSELGRGAGEFHAAPGGSPMVSGYKDGKRVTGLKNMGAAGSTEWMNAKGITGGCSDGDPAVASGTSIFDPVLCELVYRWFSPTGGLILDPFAGGSVRGVVASKLGRRYIGHELREEQVAANRAQGDEICGAMESPPAWIAGDSRLIDRTCSDVNADFLFSCPPYADLEVYSDNPKDLSTMKYAEFKAIYAEIIAKACVRLVDNSFACFVVGEVRDKKGNYIDFVGDTVQAFRDAGLTYYNEIILVTSAGSLPIRAAKQFSSSRKIGKTHQNVLVFVKGDGKKAAARCGTVEVDESMFDGVGEDES